MSKKFEDEFQPGAGVCSTVSSVGRTPDLQAGGRGFDPRPG